MTSVSNKRYSLRLLNRTKTNTDIVNENPKRKIIKITGFQQISELTEIKIERKDDVKIEKKDGVKERKRPLKEICSSSETEIKKKRVVKTEKKPIINSATIKTEEKSVNRKYVGAHVSIIGGLQNAVTNAIEIGAKSFGLFLRSQRQWINKPLTSEVAELFRQAWRDHDFSPHLILPHGSYLLNCGSPNEETLKKSRAALVEELKRCEMLGLVLFNFHPGSTCGKITIDECLDRIGESINLAHAETKYVTTVIENMSKQGHTVGGDFKELRGIIDRVKDKSRIGVCLDTCHAFAAGYNLSTEEGYNEMMTDFENIIGLKYLKALHINDSMGKVGCHLDRHENIGRGHIGLKGFKRIMNDDRFNNIPMILETPPNLDDSKEIEILYKLCT